MLARDALVLCVALANATTASAHAHTAAHATARLFYPGTPGLHASGKPGLHKPHNNSYTSITTIWDYASGKPRVHNESGLHNNSYTSIETIWDYFNTHINTTTGSTRSSVWARLPTSQSAPALQRVRARCAFCGNTTHTHARLRPKTAASMPAMRTNRTAVRRAASFRVTRQHTLWQ